MEERDLKALFKMENPGLEESPFVARVLSLADRHRKFRSRVQLILSAFILMFWLIVSPGSFATLSQLTSAFVTANTHYLLLVAVLICPFFLVVANLLAAEP